MAVGPNNLSAIQRVNKDLMMKGYNINICANQATLKWRGMIKKRGIWVKITDVHEDFNEVFQYCLDYIKEKANDCQTGTRNSKKP